MDLGPIAGIRSVILPNSQRAKSEDTPHFEIGASERSGDDPTKNQDQPEQRPHEEEFRSSPDPSVSDAQLVETEVDPEGQHNWFV